MRLARELRDVGTRPALITVASHVGQPVGRIGVVEAFNTIRDRGISIPQAQAAARKWAMKYRPEELIINLRPGLPCWLGFYAVQRGWPLTVVVSENQLAKAPSDVQNLLIELWFKADRTHACADVFQRDALIRSLVPVVGIEEIMRLAVPIMGEPVIPSGQPDDDQESEVDYGNRSAYGTHHASPQGA